MHKPELYHKSQHLTRKFAVHVVTKHSSLLQATENRAVLDVGCGPGHITFNNILPLLPKTTKKLIGVDISPAQIEYAKKNFGEDPRISYEELDVTTETLPKHFIGTFDLVLSLCCLHCVEDQRKAVTNLWLMLKPNGKLLISLLRQSLLSEVYQSMHDNPKWTKYMVNFNYYFVTKSAQYYKDLFDEMGFDKVEIEESDNVHMSSEKDAFDILTAINMFVVPDDLMKEFVEDQLKYFFNSGFSSVDEKGQKQFYFPHTAIIISAVKKQLNLKIGG